MGPVQNNTLNKLLSKLLQHLDNLNVSGFFTSHGSTSHGPSGGPVAYHTGPYGNYAPSLAQPIGAPLGFSYQPTQPDSSGHMDTSGQATVLPYAFTMSTIYDPASGAWNFDTGASSHLNNSVNSLSEIFNTCMYPSVSVGDGHFIPVTNMGHSILPTPTRFLHLNNVLITPHIVKNLIYVRQFVRDNNCTIEFDAFGFFVKDFLTRRVLLRCDSTGDLYPVTTPSPIPHAFLVSQHTWHQRLGHPGGEVLRCLVSSNFILCNKEKPPVLCHACQLGKHVRLPFVSSSTVISSCFDIIHSDVWTSPILSLSGFKYYGIDTAYLLLYVDDIVLTASSNGLLQWIISSLHQEFAMTDLGPLNYILGISVTRDSSGLFLSQKKYAIEILKKAHMVSCNPSRTSVDTESKLGVDGDPVSDPTLYWSLAGSLQYLTFTRPDISYAVQQVCLYMHDPREPHLSALKRILRYVQDTLNFGLQLFSSSTTDLVAYSDADWAGCPTTQRSTSGYCVFLGNNLLSWSAKHQPTLSRSSAEAEYRGVANVVAETCWLRNLLHLVAAGQVRVLHVSSRYQYADIFTKGLPSALFEEFRTSLERTVSSPQPTAEC
ncbi:ribonuclease H-like domain-containing protein [Tanacetum coccineum]